MSLSIKCRGIMPGEFDMKTKAIVISVLGISRHAYPV